MRSSRWDAQGNIYLVTEESLTAAHVRAEVGDADGILEVFAHGDDWLEIAIWNPDGSRAEMSGNGTRIAARWLADEAARVRSRCGSARARWPRAGCPTAGSSRISARWSSSPPEEVAGVRFVAVDVGNPHAVVDGDPADLPRIGPLLEVHERFPHRTNVQVARLAGDGEIEARVWERGVGETASSGSSAVAVAAAFGGSPAVVRFPGGTLHVRFEGGRAFLTGPPCGSGQPPSPYSRSASFSEVFRSVASLRRPMISAHARLKVPAGNSFGLVPGTTIARGGT